MNNPEVDPDVRHEIQPGSPTHIVVMMGIPTGFGASFLVNENKQSEQSTENEALVEQQSFLVQTFGTPDLLAASVATGLVACTAIAVAIERCKRRGELFTGFHRSKK